MAASFDPWIVAAREIFAEAVTDMVAAIVASPAGMLNDRPAGDDTNSIAVLAVHSMHSTRSWIAVATGAPLPARDRAAEFAATAGGASQLIAAVEAARADCEALLDAADVGDWSVQRKTHVRPGRDRPDHVAAAWALAHALEHLREHVGQMALTVQLHAARSQ